MLPSGVADHLPEPLPIARAVEGEPVVVTGRAGASGGHVDAPLTAALCAGYLLRAYEQRQIGARVDWELVAEEAVLGALVVRDASGKAFVDGAARIDPAGWRVASRILDDVPAPLEAMLARHGRSSRGGFFKKRLRFDELVPDDGLELWAFGLARWEPDPSPDPGRGALGYRVMAQRLALRAAPGRPPLLAGSRDALARLSSGPRAGSRP
jgi:hypothetical protein